MPLILWKPRSESSFCQGTPAPLRNHLTGHQVFTAFELGWSTLKNCELLAKAETEDFQIMVTTDQNLKYQQDLTNLLLICDLNNHYKLI